VIPVRDDARRAVRGIIHDRSQSGATVFVEPEETIPLNNELTRLCLLERDEEQRVLGELTDAVRHVLPALAELVEGLGALDLIFARAALAERLQAAEPERDAGGDLAPRGRLCWSPRGGEPRRAQAMSSRSTSECRQTGPAWS
jgi:DNA mismatch repair protein MutS2